ncbi:alpha/beta-hydrolase [Durotheca rogersii]|uniref:alpha/beta-hydrolase n=1 Tax=Durotheca rogersii TaxID=419775 RepID=UPI0022202C3D|nr:alpha/beta-hydrolase [Durotheca rogersii]KAI5866617.1 alpha/beta-hydrolase [Durotheca rogersii]
MRAVSLLSLMAGLASSRALKYTVPMALSAADCTFPALYEVADFTIHTGVDNSTASTISFRFADVDTGIDTRCERNSTSKPNIPGSNRWPCDHPDVAFIYQTTGIAGLTMIEAACPGSVPQFEASGLVRPELACTNSTMGSTCVARQSPIDGDFDSLQPAPRPPPARPPYPTRLPSPHAATSIGAVCACALPLLLPFLRVATVFASGQLPRNRQHPLGPHEGASTPGHISPDLFDSLERLSRLVDITYCVGTTGIAPPFSCASRCKDFPTLDLVTTWNTGVLMSDSCGYIAVDHGTVLEPKPSATTPTTTTTTTDGIAGEENVAGGQSRAAIIVAFRGTYSITNTVVDLSTIPQEYVPYPPPDDGSPGEPEHRCYNCTAHMGFLASWKIARDVVLPALKPLREQYPDYPVHLVGHSLGGAVAALAALELRIGLGWGNLTVTTFGEPRVGNDGFVKYLDSVFELGGVEKRTEKQTYRRVTHVDDPIPLLPLSEWGYRSHAGEFFITKSTLPPEPSDIRPCIGDTDPECIASSAGEYIRDLRQLIGEKEVEENSDEDVDVRTRGVWDIPTRFKLWQLFFAHRDYFWRLGLCVPGGDPIDWGRGRYPDLTTPSSDEL